MRYLDKADNCQWCKKEMDSGVNGERPKLFCSDACRYRYHNAQSKLKREVKNASRAIAYIQSMMLKSGNLGQTALKLSRETIRTAMSIDFDCRCRNCGQYRSFIPLDGEVCDACQDNDWQFFQKKAYNLKADKFEVRGEHELEQIGYIKDPITGEWSLP